MFARKALHHHLHRSVPARLVAQSTATATATATVYHHPLSEPSVQYFSSWEASFPRAEVLDPWSIRDLPPLSSDYTTLDQASRFLIQRLQDWKQYQHDEDALDRPTTDQCDSLLTQLAALEDTAERIDSILIGMETFYGQKGKKLPNPSLQTYSIVLRLFAKQDYSPHRAHEIAERMQRRYTDLGEQTMKPDTMIWNQVLSAWAISTSEEEKAFHAANLLQQMRRDNLVDISSYGHVLRACAKSDINVRSTKLGGEVACKIWRDMTSKTEERTSYTYTFFLQACSLLPNGKRRESEAVTAFNDCVNYGYTNPYVMDAFQRAMSPSSYARFFGDLVKDNPSTEELVVRIGKQASRNSNLTR